MGWSNESTSLHFDKATAVRLIEDLTLRAVEDTVWKKVKSFMSPEYSRLHLEDAYFSPTASSLLNS
jgi:hypothetical protein